MSQAVLLPLVLLGAVGWAVPWLLAKVMPEGVAWLVVIGLLSAMVLTVIAALGFYMLYGRAADAVLTAAPWHFVVLSARAALVWGPIMVLSVANLPKGWKEAVW